VDHPYCVISKDTPSLLPQGAIAVRFPLNRRLGDDHHGQELGSIVGDFGKFVSERDPVYDEEGA